jgi:hypothetical protein
MQRTDACINNLHSNKLFFSSKFKARERGNYVEFLTRPGSAMCPISWSGSQTLAGYLLDLHLISGENIKVMEKISDG